MDRSDGGPLARAEARRQWVRLLPYVLAEARQAAARGLPGVELRR